VQADTYSPEAYVLWWADVDGFSLACEHSSTPEFQVLLGKSSILRSTNQIGDTTELMLAGPALDPSTTYYWRVGAVRDGVTNFSATAHFRTGLRVLPQLTVTGLTSTGVGLSFPSLLNRNYTIEQIDSLDGSSTWHDAVLVGPGTGFSIQVEVPFPQNDTAFWRLRVTP